MSIFDANRRVGTTLRAPHFLPLARKSLVLLAGIGLAASAHAAFNVTISSAASTGGAWNDTGATKIWLATATGANVSVAEVQSRLATASVQVSTGGVGSAGAEAGDLTVNNAVAWSVRALDLVAARDIVFNANLTGTGTPPPLQAQLLRLLAGQSSPSVGDLRYAPDAKINLAPGPRVLSSQSGGVGAIYTVITALGVQGSVTGTDLQGMNATQGNTSSAYYALGADIDASATSGWEGGAGFLPLGAASSFSGDLHGLNHVITGLTINRPTAANVGLFADMRGNVRDVRISGGSFIGLGFVGALAASTRGAVYRVGASASASNLQTPGVYPSALGGLVGFVGGGSITASYATGNVTAVNGGDYAGGLAGFNRSDISKSFATGNVLGGDTAGGLVGYQQSGTITNAYATGNVTGTDVVGGLLGYNHGTVSNTFSTGVVTSAGSSQGGLIGINIVATVTNGYWNPTLSTQATDGGGAGTVALNAAQMQQAASFVGFDFVTASSPWRIYEGHSLPLIRALLIPLAITADNAVVPYDGATTTSTLLANASYNPAYASGSPLIFGLTAPYGLTPYQPGARLPDLWSTQTGFDIGTINALLTVSAPTRALDIDDSFATGTTAHALTDGVLALRGMLNLTGNALTAGARGPGATRDAAAITQRLTLLNRMLDIDNNGSVDPATDGVLVMRYLLGFRGSALTANAVGACPLGRICRASNAAIESYLLSLTP